MPRKSPFEALTRKPLYGGPLCMHGISIVRTVACENYTRRNRFSIWMVVRCMWPHHILNFKSLGALSHTLSDMIYIRKSFSRSKQYHLRNTSLRHHRLFLHIFTYIWEPLLYCNNKDTSLHSPCLPVHQRTSSGKVNIWTYPIKLTISEDQNRRLRTPEVLPHPRITSILPESALNSPMRNFRRRNTLPISMQNKQMEPALTETA